MNLIEGVAYVAHPYGGKDKNIKLSETIIEEIHKTYPCLVLLNPLDIFFYEKYSGDSDEYIAQIEDCLSVLDICKCLILTGEWEKSRGCLCEFGYDKGKGIQIFEWQRGELHEM